MRAPSWTGRQLQGGGECSAKRAGELSWSPVPQGRGDKLALGAPAAALRPRGLLGVHRDGAGKEPPHGLDRGPGGGASARQAAELSRVWARVGHGDQLVRSLPGGPASSFPSPARGPSGTWRAERASPGNRSPATRLRRAAPRQPLPRHPPLARCPGQAVAVAQLSPPAPSPRAGSRRSSQPLTTPRALRPVLGVACAESMVKTRLQRLLRSGVYSLSVGDYIAQSGGGSGCCPPARRRRGWQRQRRETRAPRTAGEGRGGLCGFGPGGFGDTDGSRSPQPAAWGRGGGWWCLAGIRTPGGGTPAVPLHCCAGALAPPQASFIC